jgi:hypothetical protein
MLCLAALVVFSACDNWNIPVKDQMEFYASVTPVSSWAELKDLTENSDHALLALTHDIVLDTIDSAIYVTRPLTITAFEGTRIIKRTVTFTNTLFDVSGAGDLTLGHPQGGTLILDGGAIWDDAGDNIGVPAGTSLITVDSARLTIRDGAILRNNDNDSGDGGGIYIDTSVGIAELIITGGVISGNRAGDYKSGGGVYVNATSGNSAVMTMSGGAISGNRANGIGGNGGGVCVHGDGGIATLTMEGGAISGNRASNNGGGVYVNGHANGTAKLTMEGGAISENRASATGGGVYVGAGSGSNATLTMSGGAISGNTAITNGGGVYVSSIAQFTKNSGGGVIYGSDAAAGLRNTASGNGHVAYVYTGSKKRDTTVWEGDILSTDPATGWDP